MTAYSVHVSIGAYTWDVEGNDTPHDVAATYGLADPLTIGQRLPDSDLQPNVQPDPAEASIPIIAANAQTYPNLALGDPVVIRFYSQPLQAGTPTTFYGRVSAVTAQPHDLGVMLVVSALDYTADLREIQLGTNAWPAETLDVRTARIMAEAQLPTMDTQIAHPGFAGAAPWPSVAARAAGEISAWDALIPSLDSWSSGPATADSDEYGAAALNFAHLFTRPILVQTVDGAGKLTGYRLETAMSGRRIAYDPPGRLANVAGVYGIGMSTATNDPAQDSWVLDADGFSWDPVFSQAKGSGLINKMTVLTTVGSTTLDLLLRLLGGVNGTSYVAASLQTDLGNVPNSLDQVGQFLAQMYSPRWLPDPRAAWTFPTLTWQAWSEAAGWVLATLGDQLTVVRCNVAKTPTNREWLNGVIVGWKLTVAKGRPIVDYQLMPNTNSYDDNARHLSAAGVIKLNSGLLTGVTLAQLKPRDTFADYAITRGS